MRVGNVSTAEITDATPAAPSSHISQRACQGPSDTAVIDYAQTKGYRYVQTADELSAVGSLSKGPVLGLFTPGSMTTEFEPLIAAATPGAGGPDFRCEETNRPAKRAERGGDGRQGAAPRPRTSWASTTRPTCSRP